MTKLGEEKVENNDKAEKIPSPKSVPYVLCNVFAERFSTGGITGEKKDRVEN